MKQVAVITGGIFGLFVSLIGAYFVFTVILFPTQIPTAQVLGENELSLNAQDTQNIAQKNGVDIDDATFYENIKDSAQSIVETCDVSSLISTRSIEGAQFEIRTIQNCGNSLYNNQWVLQRIQGDQTSYLALLAANAQGDMIVSPSGSYVVVQTGQELGACRGSIGWNVYNGESGDFVLDASQYMIGQGEQLKDLFIADQIVWISDSQFQFRSLNWTYNECSSNILDFDLYRDQSPIKLVTV
jgi:hypothetical protein